MPDSLNLDDHAGRSWQELSLAHPSAEPLRDREVEFGAVVREVGPFAVAHTCLPRHHLLFGIAGQAHLDLVPEADTIDPGELWVFPAGRPCRYFLQAGETWEYFWFRLADSERWRHLRKEPPHRRFAGEAARVPMLMHGLIGESISPLPEGLAVGRLYAGIIAAYLERRLSPRYNARDLRLHQHLAELWARIQADLGRSWSIGMMAAHANLSAPHFFRVVREFYHRTPGEMLLGLRMDRAKTLLRNSDIKLEALANEVGYASPYAFAKAFKRYTGSAPGRFRREPSRFVQPSQG